MRRGVIPLICDPLPEFIELGGGRVAVESDFRRWIMVLQVLEEEIPPSDKAEVIIQAVVKDFSALAEAEGRLGVGFTDEFFAAAVEFLSCGKVKRRLGSGAGSCGGGVNGSGACGGACGSGSSVGAGGVCESGVRKSGGAGESRGGKSGLKEREFDFAFDNELIFASFYEAYGIDLDVVRLHWWKFCALLSALPESTVLMRVVSLRRADLGAIADDDLRKKVRRAKAAVRIKE